MIRAVAFILLACLSFAAPAGAQVTANDDAFVVAENVDAQRLHVLGNDNGYSSAGEVLTIVDAPEHGTAEVRDDEARSYVVFTSTTGYTGADAFVYRLCYADTCDEATVELEIRMFADVVLDVAREGGTVDLTFQSIRARSGLEFVGSPLAVAEKPLFSSLIDSESPESPWDDPPFGGGPYVTSDWFVYETPAGPAGVDKTYRISVEMFPGHGGTTYLGVDDDGDGMPAEDEVRCSGPAIFGEICRFEAVQQGETPLRWWVLWHNDSTSIHDFEAYGAAYAVPRVAGDGHALFATAPDHVANDANLDVALGWRDDTLAWGLEPHKQSFPLGFRAGYIDVYEAGAWVGAFQVKLRKQEIVGDVRTPIPLVSGRAHSIGLQKAGTHRYAYIDVPEGAASLTIGIQAVGYHDLYLIPGPADADPADTSVPKAPGLSASVAMAYGNVTATIQPPVLHAGRWYLLPKNFTGAPSIASVTATVDAAPPVVRPGSYFNPSRSGSGLFLYPAAEQWTGLWYTYDRFGLPTWYYLQDAAPGADGLWRSGIHRSTWDGDSNTLTEVGELVVTPTGPDAFVASYVLDGEAGTQPLQALGRGCPAFEAEPLDVSSTWFDPAKAGSGYSVQMFPDYEYYAAYYYDADGQPRFVAAESPTFAGADATLVIQQLTGACPTCDYAAPVRTDIGLLTRGLAGGTFTAIGTDLEFAPPLSGGWTTIDTVQPLGGPGATQGCAP